MESWYLENLVCPVDRTPLEYVGGQPVSTSGRRYPVVGGVPVMLVPGVEQTQWVASASVERSRQRASESEEDASDYYLETLGVDDDERAGIAELLKNNRAPTPIDPVVAFIVSRTNGIAYKHLVGRLDAYPIPELRLPDTAGETLLDVGCGWGRWCVSAARKGYSVVGVDPSLGAVMAARRVAQQLGLPVRYLAADARYLPFRDASFDVIFSYSVLQHFAKPNARRALSEAGRALRAGGVSLIQMPNWLGARSLYHQTRRGFRIAEAFEVRYWSLHELKKAFTDEIGPTSVSVDCYFGLGLQKGDSHLMPRKLRLIIGLSERLRVLSERFEALKYIADSVYMRSVKGETDDKAV